MLSHRFPLAFSCLLASLCLTPILLSAAQPPNAPILSAKSLLEQHQAPSLVLLDVREQAAYDEAHLERAQHVDIAAWKNATKATLEQPEFWAETLSKLGISNDSWIVLYGDPLPEVARTWWILRYVGLTNVQVVDGGLSALKNAGATWTTAPVHVPASKFQPTFQPDRFASAQQLLELSVQQKSCQTLDNRSAAEFSGEESRGSRPGHVPGAIHSDWKQYLNEDGTFRPKQDLAQLLRDAGIDLDRPVITHCQSGGRSSVGALVFEWVSGKPARNYYRSWAEWSANHDLPVEK